MTLHDQYDIIIAKAYALLTYFPDLTMQIRIGSIQLIDLQYKVIVIGIRRSQ